VKALSVPAKISASPSEKALRVQAKSSAGPRDICLNPVFKNDRYLSQSADGLTEIAVILKNQ